MSICEQTLEGMLTQVKAGKSINEHDIPPEVAVTKSPQHTSDLSPRNVSQVSPGQSYSLEPITVKPLVLCHSHICSW